MIFKKLRNKFYLNSNYIYLALIFISLYITFVITNIYFNALSGADNYKYIENILFIFGERDSTYDNQGLLYYFLVSLILKLRTDSFNYFDKDIFLSETILLTNLLIFIYGLIGFYKFLRIIATSKNKSLLVVLFFCFFPTFFYLRLNMKPEILAFALLPWIFYYFEDFLITKDRKNIIYITIILSLVISSKGSIAVMTMMCLFIKYLLNYKKFNLKNIITGTTFLFFFTMLIFLENLNLGIGNLYSRSPEENYNNKASSEIILNLDFERLLKDPKKNYHKDSLFSITLIDFMSDYFELNWKEDSTLFSKNIKPLVVGELRNSGGEYNKLFSLDFDNKEIKYFGPGLDYLTYVTTYIAMIFSLFFLYLYLKVFFTNRLKDKVYNLFPLIGIFILLVNTIFGFPQNNFDPNVGDTFKVFYYSFLIPFPIIMIFNNIDFKKIKNYLFVLLFIGFTFINLGFPKANNEYLDLELKNRVENTMFCELNRTIFQRSFITDYTVECRDSKYGGKIKTDIENIPYISLGLLILHLFISLKSFLKYEK